MKRRLLDLLTIVLLLLCLAMVGLWVRSEWVADTANWASFLDTEPWRPDGTIPQDRYRVVSVISSRGHVRVSVWRMNQDSASRWPLLEHYSSPPTDLIGRRDSLLRRVGFSAARPGDSPSVVIPMWVLIALATALPLARLRCHFSTTRPGLCPKCAYDLRATPDRCPECGTAVGAAEPVV